jgi:hypothetical protein
MLLSFLGYAMPYMYGSQLPTSSPSLSVSCAPKSAPSQILLHNDFSIFSGWSKDNVCVAKVGDLRSTVMVFVVVMDL